MATGDEPPSPVVQVEHPAGSSAVVLRVRRDVDLHAAPKLGEAVTDQVARQPSQLIIDLDGARFVDTAGLAVLIYASKARPDLRLVCTNRIILRTLELTGLGDYFRICATVEAALADETGPPDPG